MNCQALEHDHVRPPTNEDANHVRPVDWADRSRWLLYLVSLKAEDDMCEVNSQCIPSLQNFSSNAMRA
jgi:hypothetical protein